jgi:hypothetical protein
MAIRDVVTGGYGNGTFAGTIALVVTAGYAIGAEVITGVDSTPLVSKPDYGVPLVNPERAATAETQLYFDDLTVKLNESLLGQQVQLIGYTVSALPDASTAGGMIFVTDETGGAVPAFSDGSNWRRITDRVIVS